MIEKLKEFEFGYAIIIIILLSIAIINFDKTTLSGFAVEDDKVNDTQNALNESSTNVTNSETMNNTAQDEKDKNKPEENATNPPQSLNETQVLNETLNISEPHANKSITINLQYNSGTAYDNDDNGLETANGIIDFTVENSNFNWDAKKENLCTRWNTYSIEDDKLTTVCYGGAKCCSFIGLIPKRENWNDIFYATYGQYGASLNNIISAQIIYVDYSLSVEEPFAEIFYSSWQNLTSTFYFSSIDFKNVCVETCALNGFNESSYNLIFEISNATLNLDMLTYSIVEELSKVLVNLAVKDNEGTMSGSYQLYKDNTPVKEDFVEPGSYNIEVTSNQNIIDKLSVENVNITKPLSATIGIDSVNREISIKSVETKKGFAINLEKIEFQKAILAKNAIANSLYKCKQWDFDREVCFGTWEKIQDLIPGEKYELTLTKEVSGFAEGDINITLENATVENLTNTSELRLINNISNITVIANNNSTINLSKYFLNIDSFTKFTYYKQDNISIVFDSGMATVVPDKDFIGNGYTFIIANNSNKLVISNLFSIVVEPVISNIAILNETEFVVDLTDPLIQQKLKVSADLYLKPTFKYTTIVFNNYEIKKDVAIIYVTVDGKSIRWLTSLNNFKDLVT